MARRSLGRTKTLPDGTKWPPKTCRCGKPVTIRIKTDSVRCSSVRCSDAFFRDFGYVPSKKLLAQRRARRKAAKKK